MRLRGSPSYIHGHFGPFVFANSPHQGRSPGGKQSGVGNKEMDNKRRQNIDQRTRKLSPVTTLCHSHTAVGSLSVVQICCEKHGPVSKKKPELDQLTPTNSTGPCDFDFCWWSGKNKRKSWLHY